MQKYELTVILNSDSKKEDQDKIITGVKKIITDENGKLEDVIDWGEKEFTFPIKKQEKGVYSFFTFACEQKDVLEINRKIRLEEKILRYLLVSSGKPSTVSVEGKPTKKEK